MNMLPLVTRYVKDLSCFLYVYSIHVLKIKIIKMFNPFPHTAILQQTTFRKILNVHSAERNEHFLSWKAAADVKTSIYGVNVLATYTLQVI